jgi:hypothetical protein
MIEASHYQLNMSKRTVVKLRVETVLQNIDKLEDKQKNLYKKIENLYVIMFSYSIAALH